MVSQSEARQYPALMRNDFNVERCDNGYVVSSPSVGALSLLNAEEICLFLMLPAAHGDRDPLMRFLTELEYSRDLVQKKIAALDAKLVRDGWNRTTLDEPDQTPLQAAYVTVTLRCNMRCPYCYQGFSSRQQADMDMTTFVRILDQIEAANPKCQVILTGGEPFMVGNIFPYFDRLAKHDLHFSILTNGTMITEDIAQRLKEYHGLTKVQVSIDGVTDRTNAVTRGAGSLEHALSGIEALAKQGIPLALAPTIHKHNLHELEILARFAVSVGADFSPNNLRIKGEHGHNLFVDDMEAYEALILLNTRLAADGSEHGPEVPEVKQEAAADCLRPTRKVKLICGMARALVNFDWNGDVYPCHLLIANEFKLGNIGDDGISTILDNAKARGLRVPSSRIHKCRSCRFVAMCGGGCRAGAYFAFGALDREDSLCDVLYRSLSDKLRLSHANEPTREEADGTDRSCVL